MKRDGGDNCAPGLWGMAQKTNTTETARLLKDPRIANGRLNPQLALDVVTFWTGMAFRGETLIISEWGFDREEWARYALVGGLIDAVNERLEGTDVTLHVTFDE